MGAIGYVFRLAPPARHLQIPIGIIDNARGGASLESLVPRHKFAEHPRSGGLSWLGWISGTGEIQRSRNSSRHSWRSGRLPRRMYQWKAQVAEDKEKGRNPSIAASPRKPDGSIRTWSVPGRSPERRGLLLQRHVRRIQGAQHQGRSVSPGLQQRHDEYKLQADSSIAC